MTKLGLWFSDLPSPELYKTAFKHSVREDTLTCFRGKTPGASGCTGSFQWTPAVQALMILLLRSCQNHYADEPLAQVALGGEEGSPASSLSFAISKQSNWLLDMFGVEKNGTASIRKLLRVSNASRKQKGPVVLSLNEAMCEAGNIEVYCGSELVTDSVLLGDLAFVIESAWKPQRNAKSARASVAKHRMSQQIVRVPTPPAPEDLQDVRLPMPFHNEYWQRRLKSMFQNEISQMLYVTDIFNPSKYRAHMNSIHSNDMLQKLGVGRYSISENDLEDIPINQRLGLGQSAEVDALLRDGPPIRILSAVQLAAPMSLFRYLQLVKGYNIELDYHFAYSKKVVDEIVSADSKTRIDGCLLTLASSVTERHIGKSSYGGFKPFMVMPQNSMRMLRSRKISKSKRVLPKQIGFLKNESWTSPLYYDQISTQRQLVANGCRDFHAHPDELMDIISEADADVCGILRFPNHNFNLMFNSCYYLDGVKNDLAYQGNALMLSEEFRRDVARRDALRIALRNAWLELRQDKTILRMIVESIVKDRQYLTVLSRLAGLHTLSEEKLDTLEAEEVEAQQWERQAVLG